MSDGRDGEPSHCHFLEGKACPQPAQSQQPKYSQKMWEELDRQCLLSSSVAKSPGKSPWRYILPAVSVLVRKGSCLKKIINLPFL